MSPVRMVDGRGWSRGETRSLLCPLAIRFWDQARNAQVREDLRVRLRAEGSSRAIAATLTPSGLYAFSWLPGLADWENQAGSLEPESPPASRPFTLTVEDSSGRFLPISMELELPWTGPGPFLSSLSPSLPAGGKEGFFLFSAPTRRVSSTYACVRGQLWDAERDVPAAHALAELEVEGREERQMGLADGMGRFTAFFPYPELKGSLSSSFPDARGPLDQQSWWIKARVAYDGAGLEAAMQGRLPDLRAVLSQAAGLVWSGGGPGAEMDAVLRFGQELVLKTPGRSELSVSGGLSPV